MATRSSILAWRIHAQRSVVGYSPWGRKESDTIEHTCTYTSTTNNVLLSAVMALPLVAGGHLSASIDVRHLSSESQGKALQTWNWKALAWTCK